MLQKRQCLAVCNKGFGSLYALSLLQIVMTLCMLLLHTTIAIAGVKQTDASLHDAQVAAIYRIKARLQMVEESCKEDEVELDTMYPTCDLRLPITQEYLTIKGNAIDIKYQEKFAIINFEAVQIQITYDLSKKTIQGMAYL